MKYDRFEDLPVWKDAMQLGDEVAQLLGHPYFRVRRGLADQLDRATVSISNNIAEGFERGTRQTLINYLMIAKGSAGETRSMLHGIARQAAALDSSIQDSRSKIQDLIRKSETISRQLQGWLEYLQNTELKGVRHVTSKVREQDDRANRRAAFLRKLEEIAPRPKDPPFES
jgi:four helix bundle protein